MFSRYRKFLPADKGFTLLEVMVAITILLLVILPLASLYVKSLTVIQNASLYSQAIQLAQGRMDLCEAVQYDDLKYFSEVYSPGFPYSGALPPSHLNDYYGNGPMNAVSNLYDNRNNPDTDYFEAYLDPTDSADEFCPVPIYRDYYNNYTSTLLDPNFNGLCDDDLDGDGLFGILANPEDLDDIEIATNGLLRMYSDAEFNGTPASNLGDTYVPGDGLYDTIVEGNYVASMDPMYRMVRTTESFAPILDYGLLLDQSHRGAVSDYRHRWYTYQNFVRMTSFIDPTPELANPHNVDTWVDQLYIHDRWIGGYTIEEITKLKLCLLRDLPANFGNNNLTVGVDEAGLVELDEYNVNNTPPVYGIQVIVTVFYLTGEGEMQLRDIDGDGELEEVPMESYGGARRIRLERMFYNDLTINGILKQYAPPRRFVRSTEGFDWTPVRAITIEDVVDDVDGADLCSIHYEGLPYLTD